MASAPGTALALDRDDKLYPHSCGAGQPRWTVAQRTAGEATPGPANTRKCRVWPISRQLD
jgi:hypothetical protein